MSSSTATTPNFDDPSCRSRKSKLVSRGSSSSTSIIIVASPLSPACRLTHACMHAHTRNRAPVRPSLSSVGRPNSCPSSLFSARGSVTVRCCKCSQPRPLERLPTDDGWMCPGGGASTRTSSGIRSRGGISWDEGRRGPIRTHTDTHHRHQQPWPKIGACLQPPSGKWLASDRPPLVPRHRQYGTEPAPGWGLCSSGSVRGQGRGPTDTASAPKAAALFLSWPRMSPASSLPPVGSPTNSRRIQHFALHQQQHEGQDDLRDNPLPQPRRAAVPWPRGRAGLIPPNDGHTPFFSVRVFTPLPRRKWPRGR